jgi:outer membrane protein assembly factor BamB
VVYLGGSDDIGYSVSALAADTGETLWRFGTGWRVLSSPAVADGIVYVGSNDGYLYALDGATGQPVWAQRLTERLFSVSTPAVVEDTVYVVGGPTVDALDRSTGHPIWAASCGSSFPSVVGPVVDGGVVYVGGDDFFNNDILCAFDAGTGEALWTTVLGTYSPGVAVDAEMLYAVTQDTVFALDKDTGVEIWKQDLGLFSTEGAPSVANGVLYIPGFRDITALETRTGSVLSTMDFNAQHEPATPVIADGRVFAAVEDEDLYVFELP